MTFDLFLSGSTYSIPCNCSRFNTDNYSIIIETWLKKADLSTLRNNIRPGATGEMYNILGRPHFYDKSFTGANTLKLVPNPASNSTLHKMRRTKIVYPKTITTGCEEGPSGWLFVKIESNVSGSVL
jgi:hypothetical protein